MGDTGRTLRRGSALALVFAAWIPLAGCESLAVMAAGVGGSAAVTHTLNGITYRTFTAPLAKVKYASLSALDRMGIKSRPAEKIAHGELIKASANAREIEIEFESLTPSTTRMKVIARDGGVFYDSATATEIILQTEKQLGNA
ncbi:MAG TPA: DUF3568 family protein [Burkholderiales bacterium]|nr:DUF3568 family protein [Burkholderiales bacterium]